MAHHVGHGSVAVDDAGDTGEAGLAHRSLEGITAIGIDEIARGRGQAKYVTCFAGAVLDVVVDIRVGSPTFGAVDSVLLDDTDGLPPILRDSPHTLMMAVALAASAAFMTPFSHKANLIVMGSGAETAWEKVEGMWEQGHKVGGRTVRL